MLYIKSITPNPTPAELEKQLAELKAENARLKDQVQNEQLLRQQLEWKLSQLLGEKYQPSSEKLSVEQLELALEGFEQAEMEARAVGGEDKPKNKKPSRSKKTQFPEHLETEVIEVEVCEKICPVTGKPREFIRWEESVKFEWVPGHFKKIIIRRAVRAVKTEEGDPLPSEPVVTAEMPAAYRVIPGCLAGIGLLVHILVGKYCDHLPLYRQQGIFKKRYNVTIDRSLMGHWIKKLSESLEILYEALRLELLSGQYLQIDETFIKMMDPDTKGKTKKAYFWVIKNPRGGVLFHFDPKRSHDVPLQLLSEMEGKLQSDGYSVYETLLNARAKDSTQLLPLRLFNCWAHARRKFKEAFEVHGPDAAWYLAEIQRLYRIEDEARENGYTSEQREALRAEKARPVLRRIRDRLETDLSKRSITPSSPLRKAIDYTLRRWECLEAYALEGNGEVEIDNNEVENAIRPTAVGKKNWLFIGHPKAGQRSAIIYTIIENCRMVDINPVEYLIDVLPRIADHPQNRISELLPRQWAEARKVEAEAVAA